MEGRERSCENVQENTEMEAEPRLPLISQSAAHPVAEDAFVTVTNPCTLHSTHLREHYQCTRKHTHSAERATRI